MAPTIRNLQNHVSQARGWLQTIKDKNPGHVAGLDLDECIRILDFTVPDHIPSSPSPLQTPGVEATEGHGHMPERHSNMLMGHDRFVEKEPEVSCFYGAYSDISFILRTIELLETRPSSDSQDQRLRDICNLFSRPLQVQPDSLDSNLSIYDVPDNATKLLDAVFSRGNLMLCFLVEKPLRDAAADPRNRSTPRNRLQLLHLVLALGYLYSPEEHGGHQCEDALRQATKHFCTGMMAGMAGLGQDLTSVQTLLCAIVFLFSGYRTSMAHSLIGTVCSSALRLGLLFTPSVASDATGDVETMRIRLLAAVLVADMLGSMILDLPPFVHRDTIPRARLLELATEAEARDDLLTAALLRQCSLLLVPLSARTHAVGGSAANGQAEASSIRLFLKALDECQRWKRDASPLMSKLGQDPACWWAKKELDMMYNMSHIVLFRPHLHYIREMYAGRAVSVAESYYALACIKVASSTIALADELRAQQPPLPLAESWLTLHTVFSAVVCLVFLVAAHPATTLPSIAWQRARVGISLIAANKCADNISTVCLEVLQMVTHTLRQTIYIDYDKIEASTASNCSKTTSAVSVSSLLQPAGGDVRPSEKMPLRQQVDGGVSREESSHGGDRSGSGVENEADRMLEQAEALPMKVNLEDFLDFSWSE